VKSWSHKNTSSERFGSNGETPIDPAVSSRRVDVHRVVLVSPGLRVKVKIRFFTSTRTFKQRCVFEPAHEESDDSFVGSQRTANARSPRTNASRCTARRLPFVYVVARVAKLLLRRRRRA